MIKAERVVGYCRVSTHDQFNERQIREISLHCNQNNLDIVQIFTEKISGSKETKDREELMRLMNFVTEKTNEISGIIITEISRLGRKIPLQVLKKRFDNKFC